ncbi:hypothetical protein SAMN05421690_101747 [Nitrosomonas sp. Nm51]|nr:hypothetical protein SAMN05421690_101747 [Nitrosomonas sp. Nm51]
MLAKPDIHLTTAAAHTLALPQIAFTYTCDVPSALIPTFHLTAQLVHLMYIEIRFWRFHSL